jgi:hypothetical protein
MFETSTSHKSEAVGNKACAEVRASVLLHSIVWFKEPACVVHVGAVVS